ncbi:MAG: D-TA family PLP-dependent enzyme [candidate division Zixibacteria bacterium]|nr:D-TA family PLP-dependent enzyme [candidate division Zixibacteria bacterium]
MDAGYEVANVDEIPSPALLVYRDLAKQNVRRTIEIAGGTERLRPHAKTHKMTRVAEMELEMGITKQKCATLQEARMLAEVGVPDVFIAYQLVGPNAGRLAHLAQTFPKTTFRTMVDDADAVRALSRAAISFDITLDLLIDLDVGQHRTGIAPGAKAEDLYALVADLPHVTPGGIHAYDGHNRQENPDERMAACMACLDQVRSFQAAVEKRGLPVPRRIMGGSISFPCYAQAQEVETSPGTAVFWDWSYTRTFKDLPFRAAALLLSRIVSIPTATRFTIDLGHKAIGADPPQPRGVIWNLDDTTPTSLQNEEHWVIETPDTSALRVGQPVYVQPAHICPCVALHRYAYVIDGGGRCTERWQVTARDRE